MQPKEGGFATEGTGFWLPLPQEGSSLSPLPRGLIAGWGKGFGAAGQGKGDGICAWSVPSASVPLWFLGVEAGRGTEMRGVSPGLAACWQLQLSGGEDTNGFGGSKRGKGSCWPVPKQTHFLSFPIRGLAQ